MTIVIQTLRMFKNILKKRFSHENETYYKSIRRMGIKSEAEYYCESFFVIESQGVTDICM